MSADAPTTVPATRTTRPAAAQAFRRHALGFCLYGGDPKRCQTCFDLERDASAESWRRAPAVVGRAGGRQP